MTIASIAIRVALAAGLVGCGSSPDESTPPVSGSDPAADPDEDFLSNGEEADLGTDPGVADTDGDGYLDGDEVLESKDPLDPASLIYAGRWPYQRFKDDIADPGFAGPAALGQTVPRFIGYDQHGELVDLYDFALHGRPVVIDLSALWCAACEDLSTWLEGKPSNLDASPELETVIDKVATGEVYWITVIFEDAVGNAAGPEHAAAWADAFPNPKVAVLADNDRALYDYFFPGGMPSVQLLEDDMTLLVYDRYDFKVALASIAE